MAGREGMSSDRPARHRGAEASSGGAVHAMRRIRPWLLALVAAPTLMSQAPLSRAKDSRPRSASPHLDCTTSCHRTHRDPVPRPGAMGSALESLCLSCHQARDGSPGLDRVPRLPLLPVEGSSHLRSNPNRRGLEFRREVATRSGKKIVLQQNCSACHDPHGKDAGMPRGEAFDARGQLLGSKPSSFAQVCFGCHAGSEAAPTRRNEPDIGLRFSPSAVSRHRIGVSAIERPDLPSLRTSPFRTKLDCVSCHDNPDPSGIRGPHLSSYPFLLKAPYFREKELGQSGERANELCLTCHDRSSILANQSFPLHSKHISGFVGIRPGTLDRKAAVPSGSATIARGIRDPRVGRTLGFMAGYGEPTPCATCHVPHGSMKHPSLVQFDRNIVSSSSVGGVDFVKTGPRQGTCTLTCHGHDHVQTRY